MASGMVENWDRHYSYPPRRRETEHVQNEVPLTPTITPLSKKKASISSLFLDSGAFSLYTKFESKKSQHEKYTFFESKEFWKYVDAYGQFVSENLDKFDYYANVDVIGHPEASWQVLRHLEKKFNLSPIPVIHYGTPVRWVHRHLDEGYDLIGLGGIGEGATAESYKKWADACFAIICNTPDKLPRARIHGFAMTTYKFLIRYPWWSVDSTSWCKWSGYGIIYVPAYKNGRFEFPIYKPGGQLSSDLFPYPLFVSQESPAKKKRGAHIENISGAHKKIISRWLNKIGVPLGSKTDWGITSSYDARIVANLRYFERLIEALPEWPWPFWAKPINGV